MQNVSEIIRSANETAEETLRAVQETLARLEGLDDRRQRLNSLGARPMPVPVLLQTKQGPKVSYRRGWRLPNATGPTAAAGQVVSEAEAFAWLDGLDAQKAEEAAALGTI